MIFEGRPDLWSQRRGTILVLGFLLVLNAIGVIAVVTSGPGSPGGGPDNTGALVAAVLGCLLWVSLLGLVILAWTRTAFALTDRRVLTVKGFWSSSFRFAEWSRIDRLSSPQGATGRITFEVTSSSGASDSGRYVREVIVWESVRWAPRTYDFIQTAIALRDAQQVAKVRELELRERLLDRWIACPYCGNLIQSDPGGATPATCPRCSAPIQIPDARPAAPPTAATEPDNVGHVRPAVHLGREAIDWYRAVSIAWVLAVIALATTFQLSNLPPGSGPSGEPLLVVVLFLLILVPTCFFLWLQAIRKWWTALRTVRLGLPSESEWHTTLGRPLRRRWSLMIAGFVGSVILFVALITTPVWLPGGIGSNGQPSAGAILTINFLLAGFALMGAAGQWALVASLPRLVEGSGHHSIESRLVRGRRISMAGLAAAFWPAGVALYYINFSASSVPQGYWVWGGVIGPIALFLGLSETAGAYGGWTGIADRLVDSPFGGSAGYFGVDPQNLAVRRLAIGDAGHRFSENSGIRSFRTSRGRWTVIVILAAAGLFVLAGTVGAGWIAHAVSSFSNPNRSGVGDPAPLPPIVVAQAGAVWIIPGDHYEYESFRLNHTASLTGNFTSSGPVIGYVMNSLDYTRFEIFGKVVSQEFSTGNVTSGAFNMHLPNNDRWYVIIQNESPTTGIDVTWSSDCVVQFTG